MDLTDDLDVVRNQVKHAQGLVHDLNDLALSHKNQLKARIQATEVLDIVSQFYKLAGPLVKGSGMIWEHQPTVVY